MQKEGKSWKEKLHQLLDEIISYSKSFEDFFQRCTECGIEYVYTPQNKVKLKFRLKDEGQQRFTRADTLGENYTPERIAEQIEQIQKALEKTVAPKSEYVYKPPTDEEFFRAFGVHLDEVDEPESLENPPPEKKDDVWAEIRDMRNADTIIADLESGGIVSLDDLRCFFWNCYHPDDHMDELAELNKKIKAIDRLIKMLKQRYKHSATYKEYQERSAFTQKSFRKKNAAEIDSYEQADKYIKEHIKAYYVDGKAPKRSDLEQQVIEQKNEYNALLPEHNEFVKRQEWHRSMQNRYASIWMLSDSRNVTGSIRRGNSLSKEKIRLNKKGAFMSKIGYIRVSTEHQETARQQEIMCGYQVDRIFSEKISGANKDRPQLKAMLEYVREGDTLYIESISRLGRSTKDLLNIIDTLNEKGVNLISHKEKIDISTPTGKFVLTVFDALSKLEREHIKRQQHEGIEIAKAQGKYKGRKPIEIDWDKFSKLYGEWNSKNITGRDFMRRMGLSANIFYRRVREYEINNGIAELTSA